MQQSSKDFCCLGVHFQSFDPDNQLKMSFEMNTKSRKIATPDKYSRIYEIYVLQFSMKNDKKNPRVPDVPDQVKIE